MTYKATLDITAKIITALVTILFISIIYQLVTSMVIAPYQFKSIVIKSLVSIGLFIIYTLCWAYAPKSYTITNSHFTINRNIDKVTFTKQSIENITLLNTNDLNGTIRTFGVGGLFGYFGAFDIPKIGSVTFYTTKKNPIVLIHLKNNEKIAISPDNLKLIDDLSC